MKWLRVKFWGVRGSVPVPGPLTMKYGGNTSCIELKSEDGDWVIFDAGTGIRVLGESLDLSKKHNINILISHPHWDHISGFPFFPPIYIPGNRVAVYGPGTFEMSLEDIINGQMKYSYFPVRTVELQADLTYNQIEQERFKLGNFDIETISLNHPVACIGYKVKYENKIFVYLGDNEPYFDMYNDETDDMAEFVGGLNMRLVNFVKGADLLAADSQYLPTEYVNKRGWGHSTTHHTVNMSIKAGVKRLFFFHHEPLRSDDEIDEIVRHYRQKVKDKGYNLIVDAAMEGLTVDV